MAAHQVYIAACEEQGGIYRFELDDNGMLQPKDSLCLKYPMYLAQEGNMLYALLRAPFPGSAESGLCQISLQRDGGFAQASEAVSVHGQVSAHLAVRDGQVYTANYISGDVTMMPDRVVRHSGHGADPVRQEAPHPHYISVTPDQRYLAVMDLGLDQIVTYNLEMEPVCTAQTPPGSGARHLAFSPDGGYAYCANELTSTVSVFRYHDGRFLLLHTCPALPDDYHGTTTAAAIRCYRGYVYLSHRGYDRITQFAVVGEKLVKTTDLPCGGSSPRDFDLIGDKLVVANENTNNVVVYRLARDGGADETCRVTLPHPLCVLIR